MPETFPTMEALILHKDLRLFSLSHRRTREQMLELIAKMMTGRYEATPV